MTGDGDVSRETGALLTTGEVAELAGVSEATVRKWVERGRLTPVNAGRKPLRFRRDDVWRLTLDRLTVAERRRLYEAWNAVLGHVVILR